MLSSMRMLSRTYCTSMGKRMNPYNQRRVFSELPNHPEAEKISHITKELVRNLGLPEGYTISGPLKVVSHPTKAGEINANNQFYLSLKEKAATPDEIGRNFLALEEAAQNPSY
jgi:hypothetical protein